MLSTRIAELILARESLTKNGNTNASVSRLPLADTSSPTIKVWAPGANAPSGTSVTVRPAFDRETVDRVDPKPIALLTTSGSSEVRAA